jgi:hypothetical protein
MVDIPHIEVVIFGSPFLLPIRIGCAHAVTVSFS